MSWADVLNLIAGVLGLALAVWGSAWPPTAIQIRAAFLVVGLVAIAVLATGSYLNSIENRVANAKAEKAQSALANDVSGSSDKIDAVKSQNIELQQQNQKLSDQIQTL